MEEVNEEEVSLFDNDKPEAQAVEEPTPEKDAAPSFEVPEKFEGKSLEDVIESYVNLEKEVGRKANEVGELRKLTDQILMNQTAQPTQEEPIKHEVGFDDFVDDPAKAVDSALKSNPTIRKLEQELEQSAHDKARERLIQRHKDADDVVQSADFLSWANESPGRMRTLQSAHVNRDADVAADLLDMYKLTRKVATEEAVTERDSVAKSTLKKAAVEEGSAPASTKKVYKRSELIQLKMYDPSRYEAMSDEIRTAYAEGRVK